jgi:23S rRNA (adenine2503-C2)-methyltransferase
MYEIKQKQSLPTGYLFTTECSKGQLETLSIGDYGKNKNIKADFLGYTNIIEGVQNGYCQPLSEKWVVTLSTQYGCPMKCTFCDVPNIKFNGNATFDDLKMQLYNAIKLFPDVKYTERLNIHFARMGEPIFNDAVIEFSEWLYKNKMTIYNDLGLRVEVIHPVLTTSLPKSYKNLEKKILQWCNIKNDLYNGQAGLQFSINSTDKQQRNNMFQNMSLSLEELSEIGKRMPFPISRKYTLNFAFSSDFIIDAKYIRSLFDPEKFMCKITPIHNNIACSENKISTINGYDSWQPYQKPEEELRGVGFDVLVFVPSIDEEDGLVTCGNVVLGGGVVKIKDIKIKIKGYKNK